MEIMKRILLLIIMACMLNGCAINYITNYSEKMRVVQSSFPEIYELYKQGEVIIDDVYYNEKKGSYHISYRYR